MLYYVEYPPYLIKNSQVAIIILHAIVVSTFRNAASSLQTSVTTSSSIPSAISVFHASSIQA